MVSWRFDRVLRVSVSGASYRRRGRLRRRSGGSNPTQAWAHPWPCLGEVWPPWHASSSPLWTSYSPRKVIDFDVCPVQFREYFFTNFSETKNIRKQASDTVATC